MKTLDEYLRSLASEDLGRLVNEAQLRKLQRLGIAGLNSLYIDQQTEICLRYGNTFR